MGKPIGDVEYGKAQRQLKECRSLDCRTKSKRQEDGFCKPCRDAHQLSKEYKRTRGAT